MAVVATQSETLLSGLSSFWQTLFEDRDQLNALYAATESLLGQVYLDTVTEVLNASIDLTPVFNRKYWQLVTVREDNLVFTPGRGEFPWRASLPDAMVDTRYLMGRIYDPAYVLERGTDFEIESGQVFFSRNLFAEPSPGAARRRVDVERTAYRSGVDGRVDASDPRRVRVGGVVRTGLDAVVGTAGVVKSTSASFSPSDNGRLLVLESVAGDESQRIRLVLDASTVRLGTSPAVTGGPMRWRVEDERVFYPAMVGLYVALEDPAQLRPVFRSQIVDVDADGRGVVLRDPAPLAGYNTVAWSLESGSTAEEMALWAPDALFDLENLYLGFGYLINRRQPSSESYRALIKGIFQYFIMGPALSRVEAALNVMVGIPVVREGGERVLNVFRSQAVDVLVTNRYEYRLPGGALRDDLVPGKTLKAFDALSKVFTVTDHIRDPHWFYNKAIPLELIDRSSVSDRQADPQLYASVVGSPHGWSVGDPRGYIGADETGQIAPTASGWDASVEVGASVTVHRLDGKFQPSWAGAAIICRGRRGVVLETSLNPTTSLGTATVSFSPVDAQALLEAQDLGPGIAQADGSLTFSAAAFSPSDNGYALLAVESPGSHSGTWRVAEVLSAHSVRVVPHEVAPGAGPFAGGAAVVARRALPWGLVVRPPVKHNVGFNLMQDYLRHNVCYVSFDFNRYALPYPRAQEDIQEVLLAGKPSHAYVFFSPKNRLASHAQAHEPRTKLRVAPEHGLSERHATALVDGAWAIGGHYLLVGREVRWASILRNSDMGLEVPLLGSERASHVTVTAVCRVGGVPEEAVDVAVLAWNGASFAETGTIFTLSLSGSDNHVEVPTHGNRLALRAEVRDSIAGMSDTYLLVGYRAKPGVLALGNDVIDRDPFQGVWDGVSRLDAPFVTFHAADLGAEVWLDAGHGYKRYVVGGVTELHAVELHAVGSVEEPPHAVAVQWYFGGSRQWVTPVCVGGANVNVQRGSIVDWPVEVLLDFTG